MSVLRWRPRPDDYIITGMGTGLRFAGHGITVGHTGDQGEPILEAVLGHQKPPTQEIQRYPAIFATITFYPSSV